MKDNKEKEINIKKETLEKEIVLARLEILIPDICFASGGDFKSYSRDMIISEIKNDTYVGKEFIKTEMEFLRALKNGALIKKMVEVI